jgi:hypothetical protein
MNPKILRSAAVALAVLIATPALAHHAAQAQFDVTKTVQKKGVLKKVMWINPHPYLYIEVKEGAKTTQWALEAVGINALRRQGMNSKSALPIDTAVNFSINPARNGKSIGLLTYIEFPDGRHFDFRNVDPSSN